MAAVLTVLISTVKHDVLSVALEKGEREEREREEERKERERERERREREEGEMEEVQRSEEETVKGKRFTYSYLVSYIATEWFLPSPGLKCSSIDFLATLLLAP